MGVKAGARESVMDRRDRVEGGEIRERQKSVNKWLKRRLGEGKCTCHIRSLKGTKDAVRPCLKTQSSSTRRNGSIRQQRSSLQGNPEDA